MSLLAKDANGLDEQVGNHLTPDWATVRQSDPIAKAVEAMQKHRMRFVCVTNVEGQAVALTGQKGLMEYIAEHFPQAVLNQTPGTKTSAGREGA
jgi:predicted transcriptional regulator